MIILIILFIIGSIYSIRNNNKILLNINIFLLFCTILYKLNNFENYKKCSNDISNDTCLLHDEDNTELRCTKYGYKMDHCKSFIDSVDPLGSLDLCFSNFGGIHKYISDDNFKFVPTCDNIGLLLYDKDSNYDNSGSQWMTLTLRRHG